MDLMYTVRFDPEEFVCDSSEAVEIQVFLLHFNNHLNFLNEVFYLCIVLLHSMKAVIEQYVQLTAEKDAHITKTESTLREFESEIRRLRDAATRWVNPP